MNILSKIASTIVKILKDVYCQIGKMLFPQLEEYKQVKHLALKIEARIRHLNNLPVAEQNSSTNLVDVLKSANLLLDRFIEVSEHQNVPKQIAETENPITEEIELIPEQKEKNKEISLELPQEPKLSETAKELIKLRDSVLLAKTGSNTPNSEILEVIYQSLAQILEKEGITTLEKIGQFDYEQQRIVSTQVTDDPEMDEIVCETVRPGYLLAGNIIRPQEVIIYTCNDRNQRVSV